MKKKKERPWINFEEWKEQNPILHEEECDIIDKEITLNSRPRRYGLECGADITDSLYALVCAECRRQD